MTKEEFNQILSENEVVVADLGAEWCGPCKAMEPVMDELASEYTGKAKIVRVDVEDSPEISSQYRVRNIPTILYFKGNELKDKTVGGVSRDTIVEKISGLI